MPIDDTTHLSRRRSDRLAVCQNPHGFHEHVEVEGDPPARCFTDCDCAPRLYVALDAVLAALRTADNRVDGDYGISAEAFLRERFGDV